MDDYHPTSLLFVSLAFLGGLYAFFFATSLAITRSRSKRLRELLKEASAGDPKLGRFIVSQAKTFLLTSQTGMFLCAFFMGALCLALAGHATGRWAGRLLEVLGPLEFVLWFGALGLGVVFFTLGLLQLTKPLIFAHPETFLSRTGVLIVFFSKLFSPFIVPLETGLGRLLSRLGIELASEREFAVSAEELSEIVEISSEAGELEREEKEMIQGVVHFSGTLVREVMTPRKDVVSVEESASLEEILKIFQSEKLSRILVCGGNLDDVRGVLLAKDFISLLNQPGAKFELKRFMRRAYFVSNTKKVDRLLEEFRR
ncbi:MAG: CNNM domain-containing protein, partial [Oligoflexia bacterium]|nr:CNNM domain-containing protein [Oligoflexia bacterium]